MTAARQELIDAARALVIEMALGNGNSAGGVAAAMRSIDGRVYASVCMDLASGPGAEVAAIAQMVANHRSQIETVVAVDLRPYPGTTWPLPRDADLCGSS